MVRTLEELRKLGEANTRQAMINVAAMAIASLRGAYQQLEWEPQQTNEVIISFFGHSGITPELANRIHERSKEYTAIINMEIERIAKEEAERELVNMLQNGRGVPPAN